MTVSLVSYGLGNLGSVVNMLKRVRADVRIVSSPDEIEQSERLLLPGVGAFDTGMSMLDDQGLSPAIRQFAASGRPVFGICLGMQLLLDSSEEGQRAGLGLISGRSIRFREETGVRVPHMGWNSVDPQTADPLVDGLPDDSRFYFVHSYHAVPADDDHVIGVTKFGVPFASMIRSGNVRGAQFHPEKSHHFGMLVLKNFATL
jgi:glutamine amidotransferase